MTNNPHELNRTVLSGLSSQKRTCGNYLPISHPSPCSPFPCADGSILNPWKKNEFSPTQDKCCIVSTPLLSVCSAACSATCAYEGWGSFVPTFASSWHVMEHVWAHDCHMHLLNGHLFTRSSTSPCYAQYFGAAQANCRPAVCFGSQ